MSRQFRGHSPGGGARGRGRGRGRGDGGAARYYRGVQRGRREGGSEQPPESSHIPQDPATTHTVRSDQKPEDAVFKDELAELASKLSINVPQWPSRPAYGTQGKNILVRANHMAMAVLNPESRIMHRYDVQFAPPHRMSDPTGKKRSRLMALLLTQLPSSAAKATDFARIIIANQSLGFDDRLFLITYSQDDETASEPDAPIYQARVQSSGTLSSEDIMRYLQSSDPNHSSPASREEIIQALNIIAGHGFKSASKTITSRGNTGSNRHFPFKGDLLDQRCIDKVANVLHALRGYAISIRLGTGRLLLNIQVKHIAIYAEGSVANVIEAHRKNKVPDRQVERYLRNCSVRLELPNRRSFRRITGFAHPGNGRQLANPPVIPGFAALANQVRFSLDGRMISVAQHFQSRYGRQVRTDLPVLNLGTAQNPSYYPAEMCIITPGQPYNAQLQPNETTEMIKFAVRRPALNEESINTKGRQLLGSYGLPIIRKFGLDINPALITVPARILVPPQIHYTNRKSSQTVAVPAARGSWNLRDIKFSHSVPLQGPWATIWLTYKNPQKYKPQRDKRRGDEFENFNDVVSCLKQFQQVLITHGIAATEMVGPFQIPLEDEFRAEQTIADFLARQNSRRKPRFILFLLPEQSKPIRDAIKRLADLQFGFNHVCCVSPNFGNKRHTNGNVQYFANVALKINLKLGGRNQHLNAADLKFIADGKTMLVGLDVTHPSPGSRANAPSVVGIVASIDGRVAQFPAAVCVQEGRQEEVEALTVLFESRLRLWQGNNQQRLPEEIIVFRDGVSEGQYNMVLDKEMTRIKDACKRVYPPSATDQGYPHLTMIVVGKRHNTRFYPTHASHTDRSSNIVNGAVVDRDVTEARLWDFYLQAHTALQGTARPAHYVVLHDEIFRRRAEAQANSRNTATSDRNAADLLQALTHNLCYMFGRATKAVSVCPPAYYADLVCDRARCWLSNVYDPASDAASVSSGTTGAADNTKITDAAVGVHDDVKNTMFYI